MTGEHTARERCGETPSANGRAAHRSVAASDYVFAMPGSPLTRALIIAAVVAIGASLTGLTTLHYVAKPLATSCCVAIALTARPPVSARYRLGIAAGLIFGLAGDVWLMIPGPGHFAVGLGAFLAGHLAYLVALTDGARFFSRPRPVTWFAVVGVAMSAALLPNVEPSLRVAVTVYAVVLCTMAAQARVRALVVGSPGARLAATGAALFVVSDAALSLDRFVAPVPWSTVAILSTYWMAQWALATSVRATAVAEAG